MKGIETNVIQNVTLNLVFNCNVAQNNFHVLNAAARVFGWS